MIICTSFHSTFFRVQMSCLFASELKHFAQIDLQQVSLLSGTLHTKRCRVHTDNATCTISTNSLSSAQLMTTVTGGMTMNTRILPIPIASHAKEQETTRRFLEKATGVQRQNMMASSSAPTLASNVNGALSWALSLLSRLLFSIFFACDPVSTGLKIQKKWISLLATLLRTTHLPTSCLTEAQISWHLQWFNSFSRIFGAWN